MRLVWLTLSRRTVRQQLQVSYIYVHALQYNFVLWPFFFFTKFLSLLLFSILFSAKALALSLFSVNVSDDVKAHELVVGSASNHFEGLLLYLTNALEKAYSS